MILLIEEYGVSIEQENYCFKISRGEISRTISPEKVTGIVIHKPCQLTSSAILLAVEAGIRITFMDSTGTALAHLQSPNHANHANLRRKQVYFTIHALGLKQVLFWIKLKIEGQIANLNFLGNRVNAELSQLSKAADKLNIISEKIQSEDLLTVTKIRAAEAHAGRTYWASLSKVMTNYSPFEKREKRPATDPFNSLLNYGYGMLYNAVENACILSGLDAQIGIMHGDGYGRPSLTFDTIEPFRPWVDRLVMESALSGKLVPDFFETTEKSCFLNSDGKRWWIPLFLEMMDERCYLMGNRLRKRDHIQKLHSSLAVYLLREFKE